MKFYEKWAKNFFNQISLNFDDEKAFLTKIYIYKQTSTANPQILISFKTNGEFEGIEILVKQKLINKISNKNLKFLVGREELSLERIVFGTNFDHKEEIFRNPIGLLTFVSFLLNSRLFFF